MATQIFGAFGYVINPVLVEGYNASRVGGTIVHPVLGSPWPDITLRRGMHRSGTLRLFFTSESAARQALEALAAAHVFSLTSTDREIGMSFVVPEGREIRLELDEVTRDHWHIDMPYQEVEA